MTDRWDVSINNIGNSGEYYIAGVLSSNNFVSTITLGRAEKYDIICVSPKGKTFKISVKTTHQHRSCMLGEKDERKFSDDKYYAFVDLIDQMGNFDFWIVPSSRVAEVIKEDHIKYMENPKLDGTEKKETTQRKFHLKQSKYFPENWEDELKSYYKNITPLLN